MSEEVNTTDTAADRRRTSNPLAVAGFVVSLLSFSIGVLNLAWGYGLIAAVAGLGLSVGSMWRRGGRVWGVGGIVIAALFLLLTLTLSAVLGLPLSRMMRL